MKKITIIGAGLVGSLLSILLAKRSYQVNIFEKRPDMRKASISAGKSINLALSDRGWKALTLAGIDDDIRKIAIPMRGRMIHDIDGKLSFLPYGKNDQAIYSVSRGELNCRLMSLAEQKSVKMYFNESCSDVDLQKASTQFENTETHKTQNVESDLVIGADGAFSALRLAMQMKTDCFNYSQSYIEHGYKELLIPAKNDGGWHLEKNALHIWPRESYMLIALPNLDGSFTCTLFFPFKGEPSFESLNNEKKLLDFFQQSFPDALSLMPTLTHDFFHNPTSSLVTVRCFPWVFEDKSMLIGDAAHAIVPFFGQGMNCGFEDCSVLNQLLDEYGDDWKKINRMFQEKRKPNSDAIAELALANFVEMRDLVADPQFLLRKKIEKNFYEKHPDKWMPLYSMVTFSELPYSIALAEGKKQDVIMNKILQIEGIEKKWSSKEIEDAILKYI
jgi:kynurenine 3-monooxygenase